MPGRGRPSKSVDDRAQEVVEEYKKYIKTHPLQPDVIHEKFLRRIIKGGIEKALVSSHSMKKLDEALHEQVLLAGRMK